MGAFTETRSGVTPGHIAVFADRFGNIKDGGPASSGGGTGTVTTVSVATAAGVSGTVANPTTTPAITVVLGNITPASVNATGLMLGSNLQGTNTGDSTAPAQVLTGYTSGAGTVAATDTILQAIQKLNGNVTANAAAAVPTTRTVNGNALSANVVVTASQITTGTLPIAQGGTGATANTGTGTNVLATAPTINQPVLNGITSGTAPVAGQIGEEITASFTAGGNIVSGTITNLNNMTLTAGIWRIEAYGYIKPASTTILTQAAHGVSTSNASFPAGPSLGTGSSNIRRGISWTGNGTLTEDLPSGAFFLAINTPTIVYQNAQATFTVSTCIAGGYMVATRIA